MNDWLIGELIGDGHYLKWDTPTLRCRRNSGSAWNGNVKPASFSFQRLCDQVWQGMAGSDRWLLWLLLNEELKSFEVTSSQASLVRRNNVKHEALDKADGLLVCWSVLLAKLGSIINWYQFMTIHGNSWLLFLSLVVGLDCDADAQSPAIAVKNEKTKREEGRGKSYTLIAWVSRLLEYDTMIPWYLEGCELFEIFEIFKIFKIALAASFRR